MGKNTLTALLTDLRALILSSRPAYRDFLGEVTELRTTKILENVVLSENVGTLSPADPTFAGLVAGKTYRAVVNGEEILVIAVAGSKDGEVSIGYGDDNNYWAIYEYDGPVEFKADFDGTYAGATISVYYDETVTEQRWSVKKLAYELLPDRLLSALSAAANTARNALTTANTAQSTANAAQSTAGAAQSVLAALTLTASFAFDKQTTARKTFMYNAFQYYKISDFSPRPEDVVNFSGTQENGDDVSFVKRGENACEYGRFIVVTKAGWCKLTSEFFTAPEVGLYALFNGASNAMTAKTAEFEYIKRDLIVTSPTYKKFRIAVDDTGTLSATEVTDTTT